MTYSELKKECQEIARSHNIGDITTHDETLLLNNFFRNHHVDWAKKTQDEEVLRYEIKDSGSYGTKCLFLITESICTDIGFKGCYKNIPCNEAYMNSNIHAACRHIIDKAIIAPLRKEYESKIQSGEIIVSDISSQKISCLHELHIDHYDKDFKDVVIEFTKQEGKDFLYSHINMGDENSSTTCFTDPGIAQRFIIFHNKNTHLRKITKRENLARNSRSSSF